MSNLWGTLKLLQRILQTDGFLSPSAPTGKYGQEAASVCPEYPHDQLSWYLVMDGLQSWDELLHEVVKLRMKPLNFKCPLQYEDMRSPDQDIHLVI